MAKSPPLVGESLETEVESFVDPAQLRIWQQQNGKIITHIEIEGLKRTRLSAVEWFMLTQAQKPFSALFLAQDLQTLYNTGSLYDLSARVEPQDDGQVVVHILLKDKWTLFPTFGVQGGGGSQTVGGGLYESNLLGYLVNSYLFVWNYNGTSSYALNFHQGGFPGSKNSWSVDWQDSIEALTAYYYNGSVAGKFAWRRQQQKFMFGQQLDASWRWQAFFSLFQDNVDNNGGNFDIYIPYTGLQQRVFAKLIYGAVNVNNYQEIGYEFSVQPMTANLIGPGPQYQSLDLAYKQVWQTGWGNRDNVAVRAAFSQLSSGAPNFLYQVGGYLNVRGYADGREFGNERAYANLEWRPYILRQRWSFLDMDLVVVQGCLFSDAGSAWGDSSLTGDPAAMNFHPLWSAGAGLRINWVKFAGAIL